MKKFTSFLMAAILTVSLAGATGTKAFAATANPLTRSQAETRALKMINLSWYFDSSKNSVINVSNQTYVSLPKQLSSSGTKIGIPYCWGGLDGLDSSSYVGAWTSFSDAISRGAYAGNTKTDAGLGYIKGTAGLDCSGFVQATFGIQDYKLSTSTLFDKYFVQIDINNIKHMDILDRKGDHVVIFDKWGSMNGLAGAFTYESTTDQFYGGIQGAKKYFISMNEISKGYIAGRYVNIEEDPVVAPTISTGSLGQVSVAANLLQSSSVTSIIIDKIPASTVLLVNGYTNGFYQVQYNGKYGYVDAKLMAQAVEKYVTVNGVYMLNIRKTSDMSGQIIGTLSVGQYAKVLGTSSNGYWTLISINGITGYASSKYLK